MPRPLAALACLVLLLWPPASRADVKLPSVFSDHAVFQRGVPVPVWGWAEPGEKVSVKVTRVVPTGDDPVFGARQSAATVTDSNGRWQVKIGPFDARGRLEVTVRGNNTLTIRDVLVGEVWLCSGQSNMAMTVNRCDDFDKEQAAADYPEIRMFKVGSNPKTEPQRDLPGQWVVCSPETVGGFSGTAYFFGRKLHKELKVPVGLINSSVGGTAIEAWTSLDAQHEVTELTPVLTRWDDLAKTYDPEKAQAQYQKQLAAWQKLAAKAKAAGEKLPRRPQPPVFPRQDRNHPANLYNGMIAPLVGYAVRGAVWYQGESNANKGRAELYGRQLRLLIEDWRGRWGQGDFPFLWVQLPNFKKATTEPVQADSGWALVREGMRETLKVPHTGMAVTIDVGDPADIHPTNKQDYGRRLADVALATVYEKDVPAHGPLYESHRVEGGKVVVAFRHAEGLKARGGELRGFAVAGADRRWRHARAEIDGDRVTVWHPDVREPVAVRYGWADNPACNLYNAAGLPASPFRTDRWGGGE